MSQEITNRARLEVEKADEALFLDAWRAWRAGLTREEAEAKVAWLRANGAPIFASVARRDLDGEREA